MAAGAAHVGAALIDPDVDVELQRPEPVSERYYKEASYFCDIKGGVGHDQVVLQHSNGLCVVCLAPSHPLRAAGASRPVEVRFRGELASKKPSGKKKIGATWMVEYSPLCDVTCEDGSSYVLYASVRGNLYEVNQRLVDHPELLSGDNAQEVCYLAIIMPKRDEKKTATEKLLNQDEYNELLAKRAATAAHGDASHMQSEDDVAAEDGASTGTSLPADADTAACTSVDAE